MNRRCLLAVAGLTSALAVGCGTMTTMMEAAQSGEPVWLVHRLSWTVYQPSHRVAIAALGVLKTELAEVKIVADELSQDNNYNTPDGKMPKPDQIRIPQDYPAFWLDGLVDDRPVLVNCRLCVLQGKTKDGKKVDAVIQMEFAGSETRTVLSLQVGRKGDEKVTKALIDRISDRVIQQTAQHGSPDERAALNAAFSPRPGTDDRKIFGSGEVRFRKN